jgi:modulator of FtsH protease HflK
MTRRLLILGCLAFVVFMVWTLWTSVTQIQPGERAVVRRFGRVIEDKPGPGLHFFLPWSIDQVQIVKVNEVRDITVGQMFADAEDETATPSGQLLTGDHNLIDVQVKVYYSVIDDPAQIEKFALQSARVADLLRRVTENALSEWAASRKVETVLLEGKGTLPAWLRDEVKNRIAAYDLGIRLDRLPSVPYLAAPREVKPFFDAVTQTGAQVEKRLNEANDFARERKNVANIEVAHSESRIATHQARVRAQAQAEAAGFLGEVKQKRELPPDQVPAYLALRWWTVMSRTYDKMQETRRIRPLDDYLTGDTLQLNMPLVPGKN